MEVENQTGGESEMRSTPDTSDKYELEENDNKSKSDSLDEPEAAQPQQTDGNIGGESEATSRPSASHEPAGDADGVRDVKTESSTDISDRPAEESETLMETSPTSQSVSTNTNKMIPELTLALVGDTNSIEIGSKNILLDNDEQTNVEQFSSRLYDLCGRHISVINMLGPQNIDQFPLNRGIHAFLLLIPNGLHHSHYSSVQWLENTFGKRCLSYVMTVLTHKPDENCENALTELRSNSSLVEKRHHTCTKSVMDENELIVLLEKLDLMVSENDPPCYSRLMFDENKEQKKLLQHKTSEDQRINSSVFQQHQTVAEMEKTSEKKTKSDSLDEPEAAQPQQIDGNIGGESEATSRPSASHEPGTSDVSGNKSRQSLEISEEINRKKQNQRETETLLSRLHLPHKHQHKLSPADFLKIGPAVKQDHETTERDLAHTFVKRLMMLDYRARYIPVRQDTSQPDPVCDTVNTDDNNLDAFLFSTSVDSDQSKQTHIHPMDVQMAAFHCSDSFLKQKMITKLSQCQYALPLLVPDPVTADIECPLWTFRQIIKTWKGTQTKDNTTTVTMKSLPIYKAQTPMVAFFRLGSLSVSKSQLINTLINSRHSTFFHRNCPGSTKSRHLMDGVVEIAWYCPAGKPNDAFTDCITFCNLHGDALSTEKQRHILTEQSSVTVVLVPTLDKSQKSTSVITDLYKSQKPLIILIADSDCGAVQMGGMYKMGLKDRNQSDVSEELKTIIGKILSGPHKSFQLETMTKVSGVRVDEEDKVCQKGKNAAMEIMNLFQRMDVSNIKDKFLPCQGELWHDWCRINKEQYRLRGNIEKEKCAKQQQLMQIRQKQCTVSCGQLMKLFIKSLSSFSPTEKEYFLKWTQILIDAVSTDDLSSILQSYDEKWSEVLALKRKQDKSDQLTSKQAELEQISKKLQSATFGLEHIFREMGQIYEAHKSLQEPTNWLQPDWSKYPELAAELMISGHPMELMDGDAGHVPLTWISSLLDQVIRKLGDKMVFVLSVLGVQSSGKSTMLNAMFGLQFAVSSGRCTKGAFMQLVKLSEEIQKDFQCDYILVVDTEGLRALELAGNTTLHHDNELATFVVGLGNMTLINIFGENPAEMQDVLQIVVQAFMRMKKVKLSPSCVFVHQNVTDVAAAEKNMDGKRRLLEKLDQMAQLAAKEEVCDAKCFSDIIAFDVQKEVKYFAQLWEGSPPMAPPNPDYSEKVQELKATILFKASQSAVVTLSQFKAKIQDLWKALLNEQFVFSFKNTLEIAVYRKLEVQYGNWTWDLRSNMLTIENQLYTRIENGKLDKVELNDLFKEMSKTYTEIKKEMTEYFENDTDKEMLVQWRGRFENKIKEFHEDLVSDGKRKLDEVLQQKIACKKVEEKKTEFENKLLQKSKELAHQLKDKAKDEEELKKHFDSVWSVWVQELTADTKPIADINLVNDQVDILLELGFEWGLINESKTSGKYKSIRRLGDYSDYVSFTKHKDDCDSSQQSQNKQMEKDRKQGTVGKMVEYFSKTGTKITSYFKSLQHEDQKAIRSLIDHVEKQSLDVIKNKPVATRGYRSTYLQEMANNVKEKVAEFESKWKYALKKEFTVDLILYVFHRAEPWLSEAHRKYKANNDVVTYVENKQTQNYNIFRSFCKGNSSAVVLGELICEKLKVSAVQAVCNKTAIDLAGEMKCTFPAFNGNRLNLEKHVLKSLAEEEDFNGFINYIRQPKSQVETFIRAEVKKYIFTEHKDKALDILRKNVDVINKLVSQALFTATDRVKTQRGDTDRWMEEFSSLLKDHLTFETICCQNFSDIERFDFLKEAIERGLESISQEMKNLSLDKINESRQKPDQILIDQLCKCCWVTCPFCAAVCTNTLENHSPDKHNVPFHRPSGIKGWHFRGTVELDIDFCTTNVASDGSFYPHHDSETSIPYKQYQTAGEEYATWQITPDESKMKYWKWFVCQFEKDIEHYYGLKFEGRGEIPCEWRNYTKEEAIKSLDEMCDL
ncbi:interferon-induced very large GTPase 1-like isoform X2 [Mastacembelus armatus]|uniref:interferon-induced very large GTPase 1-like isoform X2 n=1 Tax=Mastacembelus armatus TaxID=205130 RepID=UPI000E458CCB|nr:interferon-induced very large GTPase 1-like isoform X2 [Mastacembelus armatus]